MVCGSSRSQRTVTSRRPSGRKSSAWRRFSPASPPMSAAAALAPLGAHAQVAASVDEIVRQVIAAARPGDHLLCMSNGGFGGVHTKLMEELQKHR